MITAGMDFAFQFAEHNFKFVEKIIYLTKEIKNMKFVFSTVDEYFQAVWSR
jgi:hypothetical protein